MLRKRITYTDFNGDAQTEDFYFNISKSELAEMELRETVIGEDGEAIGGMSARLQKISQSRNGQEIMDTFKEILELSYGIKSEDGKRFVKSPELFQEFLQSPAYDILFMEFVTDAKAGAAFVNAIPPSDITDGESNIDRVREKMRAANRQQVEDAE